MAHMKCQISLCSFALLQCLTARQLDVLIVTFMALLQCLTARQLDVLIVTPGLTGTSAIATITRTGPAFDVVLDSLKQDFANLHFSHKYLYNLSLPDCDGFTNNVQNILSQWFYQQGGESGPVPAYIVTPGCSESLYLNQLAAAWNMLLVTERKKIKASSDVTIKDKSKSPTWINTNIYPSLFYGDIFYRLFQLQRWTSVYVVLDDDSIPIYQLVFRAVDAIMKPVVRTVNTRYSSRTQTLDMPGLLDDFSRHSRVMLFLGSASQLRRLLLAASAKGQANGDYVFIAAVPFPYKAQGIFTWRALDQNDEIIRAAYRSVLFVTMVDATLHVSEARMEELKSNWNRGFMTTPFYGNLDLHDEGPIPQLAAVNSAMEMLAQVLNESLSDPHFDPRNGRDLARRFYNRTFATSSGRVILDRFGDRAPSVSVSYFNESKGDFQVFLQSNIVDGVFRWASVRPVSWFNGSQLPANEPPCGYSRDKEECLNSGIPVKDLYTALTVVTVVLIAGSVYLGHLLRSHMANNKAGRDGNGTVWWNLNGQISLQADIVWTPRNVHMSMATQNVAMEPAETTNLLAADGMGNNVSCHDLHNTKQPPTSAFNPPAVTGQIVAPTNEKGTSAEGKSGKDHWGIVADKLVPPQEGKPSNRWATIVRGLVQTGRSDPVAADGKRAPEQAQGSEEQKRPVTYHASGVRGLVNADRQPVPVSTAADGAFVCPVCGIRVTARNPYPHVFQCRRTTAGS
ncbi:hypothetical protein BV898_10187 [Hypsibius exemplaris]|uniref:Receptor ligand binding region domain-containing protein n=1 Tax=Hypsibius exemplaris TaxID=2072580 RepID=A0A1W0WK59_HYPEX|nr:hypothetical protein BV898_10187 [Hypsibius exemplaris]